MLCSRPALSMCAARSRAELTTELEALQEERQAQQADAADAARQQAGSSADQRKAQKRARKQEQQQASAAAEKQAGLQSEIAEAQWRRAAALRRSRPALLAEMAVWEQEAEEEEAAATAGIVSGISRVVRFVVPHLGMISCIQNC